MMNPPSDDDDASSQTFSSLDGVAPSTAAVVAAQPASKPGLATMASPPPADAAGASSSDEEHFEPHPAPALPSAKDGTPERDFSPVGDDEDDIIVDIDDLCPPAAFGHSTAAAPRPKKASTTGFGGDSDSEEDKEVSFNVGRAAAAPSVAPPAPLTQPVATASGVNTATASLEASGGGVGPNPKTTRLVATPTGPLAAAVVKRASPAPQATLSVAAIAPVSAAPLAAAPAALAVARASSPPPPPLNSIITTSPVKPTRVASPSDKPATQPPAVPAVPVTPQPASEQTAPAFASEPSVAPAPTAKPPSTASPGVAKAEVPPPQPVITTTTAPPATAAAPPQPGAPAPVLDEWDQATREFEAAEAANANAPKEPPLLNITWDEAYREIRKQTDTWQRYITVDMKRVSDRVKTTGFWGACWSCLHSDITEGGPLYDERDFVLALRQMPLDHKNLIHRRVLITCWRMITQPPRNTPDPSTTGPSWVTLGFQGNDPGTDLRANGMFGLLQLLFLVDHVRLLSQSMFEVASSRLLEFPMAIVSFNFTAVATQCLLDRLLHDTIVKRFTNREKENDPSHQRRMKMDGGSTDVAMVCNELYVGCMYRFFDTWQQETQRRITDFDAIRRSLAEQAASKTSSLLSAYQQAKTEYSREGIRAKREANLKARLDPILDKGPSRFTDF